MTQFNEVLEKFNQTGIAGNEHSFRAGWDAVQGALDLCKHALALQTEALGATEKERDALLFKNAQLRNALEYYKGNWDGREGTRWKEGRLVEEDKFGLTRWADGSVAERALR